MLALAALVAVSITAGGCGNTGAAAPKGSTKGLAAAQVVARVGHLEILHPFLPDPANPSVAAVYLTVRNTGSQPDSLVGAATPLTSMAMLMTEKADGEMDSMAGLKSLLVPAHATAGLVPGHDHLMLENLRVPLRVGQHVSVTLRFAHAGSVRVEVPVVPLSEIIGSGGSSTTTMSGM